MKGDGSSAQLKTGKRQEKGKHGRFIKKEMAGLLPYTYMEDLPAFTLSAT